MCILYFLVSYLKADTYCVVVVVKCLPDRNYFQNHATFGVEKFELDKFWLLS